MAELNSTIITGTLQVTNGIQSGNQIRTDSGVKKDGSTHIYSSYVTFGPTMEVVLGTSGITANAYGDSSAQTPGYAGTFKVPYIRVNAQGIVTDISEHTVTMPSQQSFTDHNQKIKGNGTSFTDDAEINLVEGDNITITAATSGTGAPKITIAATNTTYESKTAVSGGTDVSLVTTGEKYTWNNMTGDNQTIKGNGTTFGANAAVDIVGTNGITVTAGTNQITISGSGSTPTIPTPTSSDNGKVLAVNSSGNYALVTLSSLADVYTGGVSF